MTLTPDGKLIYSTAEADGTDHEHEGVLRPWLMPGPSSVTLWVNGRLKAVWLEVSKSEPLDLTGAELLKGAK